MNKKRGVALVTVIIIMAVLAILGVALLDKSLAETRFTAYQDRRMQAYYLAKSGVDTVSKYILQHPASAFNFVDRQSDENNELGNGTFRVEVSPGATSREIKVKGTGTVNGTNNTITAVLRKLTLTDILDKALYTNAALNITNMQITGDVQSGENIQYSDNGSNEFTYKAFDNSPKTVELVDPFPAPGLSDITVLNGSTVDFTGGGNYSDIIIDQQGVLNVKTGGNNINLVVDTLNITGKLNIDAPSGGRVNIYVNSSMTVTTTGLINNMEPKNLYIYLKKDSTFYIQASMELNGYILGPEATVEFQSNNSVINGAVFANLIRKNGTSDAPNGTINFVSLPSDTYEDSVSEFRIIRWEK